MSELFGTVWQWQNDTLADTTNYTIEFLPEGQFQLQADCNRGRGAYKLVGNLLTIDGVALTRMGCLWCAYPSHVGLLSLVRGKTAAR